MAKNLEPKCKQCRRIGEKLFLKGDKCQTPKCLMNKKNYPPGMHGQQNMRAKKSDYANQLTEKQKAKKQYNVLEKQFKLIYEKGKHMEGDAGDNLLKLLEMRFDNIIYRAGMAKSRAQARVLINHNHFKINSKKMNIPSYTVKKGEIIEIKEKSKKAKPFANLKEILKKSETPGWLNIDAEKLTVKVLHEPSKEDIKNIKIQAHIIVEYYSR
ncbi:MAG: 30S ribosomal protein S4 [Candidatus Falkowbacteria bacterium]|nr:30S ribosomal protein S4 [Candidatus Falkowbacteria bacterium]